MIHQHIQAVQLIHEWEAQPHPQCLTDSLYNDVRYNGSSMCFLVLAPGGVHVLFNHNLLYAFEMCGYGLKSTQIAPKCCY
ncbi:hypothetical protein GDO81_023594 [Engystomops pustulosus]|uniref:Uncharacterized protein n=1 Tax=Engystomops pustulosus TaxID=76066 RepID=A0AAV6YLU0_ENGPU|nr:hypothetical protein GDO81_023594 [Engystomops pustulosus]